MLLTSEIQYLKGLLKERDENEGGELAIHLKAENAMLRRELEEIRSKESSMAEGRLMDTLRSDISFKFSQL
jgi:hypothetical protein